jgi:hypothetical protein
MSDDSEAAVTYARKRLYVTDKTPALSVDEDGYVRCGLSSDMKDNDMLVLGLYMSLGNKEWKDALLRRVQKEFVGATTPTSRVTRAAALVLGQ